MSEKPILVTISRNNADDLVDFTDAAGTKKQRMGLVRCVPYTLLDKSFRDLAVYMFDPIGADGNQNYEGTERELAITYQTELTLPQLSFIHKRNNVLVDKPVIELSDLVSKYFGQIVEQKTLDTLTGPLDCKSLDLVMTRNYYGGRNAR